jgi:hypothetical protein
VFLEGLPETPDGVHNPGDGHGRANDDQQGNAARCLDQRQGEVTRGLAVVPPRSDGKREQGHSEGGENQRLARGPEFLAELFSRRQAAVVEDGIARLPQGQGNARGEAAPQQDGAGGLATKLCHGAADIGLSFAAHGQPDGYGTHQEMQDAAHREPGPRHELQRPRVGDFLGRFCGLSQFFLDVGILVQFSSPRAFPPGVLQANRSTGAASGTVHRHGQNGQH